MLPWQKYRLLEVITNNGTDGFGDATVYGREPDMNYGQVLVSAFLFFLPKQPVTIMNLKESYG